MSFVDKTLTCRDCGRQFAFTAGEQAFYQSRGLMNEPGRCPDCRRARKAQRDGGAGGSYAYSTSSEYGAGAAAGGGYGGGDGYGRAERPRRQMYPAVCSSCGRETQVPFQPRGEKPVYCSECFERVRSGG